MNPDGIYGQQYQQPAPQAQPIIINNSVAAAKKKNHTMIHLILSVVTLGAWLPVWLVIHLLTK